MKNHIKLTAKERDQIGILRAKGISISEIGRTLERSKSTISDEVSRNNLYGEYVPIYAHARSQQRKDNSHNVKKEIFTKYPCKSDTLDNGLEFVKHEELKEMGIAVYFADPYASWQRGTNEHHNWILRRYLPKGTSFNGLTQEELDDIVEEINSKPRKVLDYTTVKTPVC